MQAAAEFFHSLNREYLHVHKAKEDLFWSTYMGTSDDHAGFAAAEARYKDFISDPARLNATRAQLAALQVNGNGAATAEIRHGLQGWLALFEANIVDSEEARSLMRELIDAEARLFAARKDLVLTHVNERGEREAATLSTLATNMRTNPSEAARRSSHEALCGLERWVLENGFLEIVRIRNRFARALGAANYFEHKLHKNERMSPAQLFAILDEFVARTDEANGRALGVLRAQHGPSALDPWNLRYFSGGDVVRRMDPYMPFAKALRRWVQSFRRLGIQYRGATMQLDLLERDGKYQNGFCHGPIPSFFDENNRWVAAQINFTADAKPDQVGSGIRAINTLFHEGGHAAHFANVVQNSPCFSQEFAPTSMAYAETQSMFCDSLLEDADWLARYARNAAGERIPDELIRDRIASSQPMRAYDERGIAVVPYFEAALYALDEEDLTAENVLALARATEKRILGVDCSPRPLLSIPHLLNQEAAASYQGYLLANMAVYQTRAHFLREHGYLSDNPAIGPALAEHYWAPGNSVEQDRMLRRLTGEGFSARYLADDCTATVDEVWTQAQASIAAAAARGAPKDPVDALDATIRVVHGAEVLADNSDGEEAMCHRFEAWVREHYPAAP
jgi:oligoendopeptidase F